MDKKSDLNIYKERHPSSESDTFGSKDLESSCCASATLCCGTEASEDERAKSKKQIAAKVAEIDFNEWVSK